ncbi:MAG: hypothetical protein VYD90_13100 [Pseudomonadota bacterium]|nr:hypothetical protein [Pseudomonadota bacterium]
MSRLRALLALVPGLGPLRAAVGGIWRACWAVFAWIFADWRHAALFVLALESLHANVFEIPGLRSELVEASADETRARKRAEAAEATVSNLQDAARQAEAMQESNLRRVAAERAAKDQEVLRDYQDRLAALRARHERLQSQAAAAAARVPGPTDVPSSLDSARGTAEAPDDTGLPPALVCEPMNLHERLIASEQAEQLNALIDAVEGQAAIRTNP